MTFRFDTISYNVRTLEEYLKLPSKDRHHSIFWWVYLSPNAMSMGEWVKWRAWAKENYPVQYYLRHDVYLWLWVRSEVRIHDNWRKIRDYFFPKQKWLIKKIPNHWADKRAMLADLPFAMVVHFVDEEKCFEYNDYTQTLDDVAFAAKLKECYNFITVVLPDLQKQLENSFPKTYTGNFDEDYSENNRLEKLIDDETTKWLVWIVQNRVYFWV